MAILNLKEKLTGFHTDIEPAKQHNNPMESKDRNIRTDDGGNLRLDRRSANGDRRVSAYNPNYTGPCRRYTIERRDDDLAQGVLVNENPDAEDMSILDQLKVTSMRYREE